jgi:PAS domain S-box-containing protein
MPTPIRILFAEDNSNDVELSLVELRKSGFEVTWDRVDTEARFLEKLNGDVDIVLSDFRMPGFDGFRALELLKLSGLDIPFILISGTIGEDMAVISMKMGAADYLLKDRLTRLGAAVAHALEESRMRRDRRSSTESLRIAHAQLGQLLQHSPAVLYMLKVEGNRSTAHVVSENITKLLGFTVAETLEAPWWREQLHPDDLRRAEESIAETLSAGSSLTEYRIRHKDGHYIWIDDARRVIRDAGGNAIELIGIWTDISERKRAAEIVQQASGHVARDRLKQLRFELGIIFGGAVASFLLSVKFDVFEKMTRWFLAHDALQLDDLFVALVFVSVGLAVFAFRRWRETNAVLTGNLQVQSAFELLHDELDQLVKQRTTELKKSNRALVVEIEQHKQTETGLMESNLRFNEMLENVELIAMTLDKKGRVTFCNDYLLALTDWTSEEVIGSDWYSRFLPESAVSIRDVFFSTIEAGLVPKHLQNPIKTRSGEIRDILWSNTVLRDAKGEIEGTASIGQDVTDRNKAAKILQESEERFRQLAENIHEVFWITDSASDKIVYVSPAYQYIWGRTCASLYKSTESWVESIKPEDRERVTDAGRTKKSKGTFDEEYRIIRPDGAERWIRDRAFPVRDSVGTVIRCVGVAEDITESKLLQEQFLRAQRMEAVGTLSGGIAHDLNNILAPILMAPAMLREHARTDHERRLLALIETSAQRGADIVRQLLTFSRGSGGERISVQLQPLLHEMAGIMRETFPREIVIRESASAGLPFVLGDPTQLHQVIMNLCVNARDAMASGGVLSIGAKLVELNAADVKAHPPAKPGPHVALCVSDTGEGIAPANLDRIFDPFFTTKAPNKGTGLGLSTVIGIIRSHHGFIAVTSALGQGTSFTIYLPAAPKAAALAAAPAADAPPVGHGELILVVDDEEPIRAATRMTLEHNGYRVLTASEGAEALATFVENREDVRLVLTDLMMPVMGGVTLINAIHVLEPAVKVIATSGLTDKENQEKLAAVGVDGTIPKPCAPDELLKMIALHLAKFQPNSKTPVKFDDPLSV